MDAAASSLDGCLGRADPYIYTLRHKYLEHQQGRTSNAGISVDELERRTFGALPRLLSPLSRIELAFYEAHGITFDDPASPSNSTAEASRSSASINQPPPGSSPLATETEQPFRSAPPRSSFALPASLQTKLLPPSLSDLLLGLDQASTLPWSDELEKIYQLVPESNWKQLEADYEELIRRVCAARSEGRSEAWKQLQEALFAARRNIMHVHSLRNRHQQHAQFELAASRGEAPLQLSAKLPPLATLLSLEEKSFFAGYGIDLSIPSSKPRSPSPHPPSLPSPDTLPEVQLRSALEHPHQPSIALAELQWDLQPSTDEPLIEFD
ncbi:hypothetical protein BCR35DRAFT_305951 [Leucosporidium creatinivorum]|uniref:Uncharacterized protein n=1 Tax=Leucosporidium creatinivorum TaxID=106004 RepID=A0A1Y2EZX9_9BASI|nr:hypothetical protein BCR35DRAFT_305951 [Leucosporidium creatinivorum]